jgi:hypothetical protein
MRLFLGVLLLDLVLRPLAVLYPWKEWCWDYAMDRLPNRLPTERERAHLREERTPGKPDPLRTEIHESLGSLRDYWNPWPSKKVRKKLETPGDCMKYGFAWVCSRLEFLENVLGFDEEWEMFSPNVSRGVYLTRNVLLYEDGSERIVRSTGDPEDLTRYAHWFEEKVLDHELKVKNDYSREDEILGWCNLLAHRYAVNKAGSPLVEITLLELYYRYPPPGEDATAFLKKQMELTEWPPTLPVNQRMIWPYYRYDVATRQGHWLGSR